VTANLESRDDPWQKLAAIHAQAELVRRNAIELEQLGLTLSGRDVATVDRADLVSYVCGSACSPVRTGWCWPIGVSGWSATWTVRCGVRGLTPPAAWSGGPMPARDVCPAAQAIETAMEAVMTPHEPSHEPFLAADTDPVAALRASVERLLIPVEQHLDEWDGRVAAGVGWSRGDTGVAGTIGRAAGQRPAVPCCGRGDGGSR